jgi:hypothetical protein
MNDCADCVLRIRALERTVEEQEMEIQTLRKLVAVLSEVEHMRGTDFDFKPTAETITNLADIDIRFDGDNLDIREILR